MALKAVVATRVLDEILGPLHKKNSAWKVLILDKLSTRIISSCCKMHDVMSKGITLVEALEKPRQPLPHLEAVYFMVPSEENIQLLIGDFSGSKNLYKTAHIYFIEKCSQSLFSKLGSSSVARKIATLQEANMAFLPYESKVFTLDFPECFELLYTKESPRNQLNMVERIADQLATVCAMLGEYPAVRYRTDVAVLSDIAQAVQTRLDSYKADKRDLGAGEKSKSQLIILDRGFDVKSPILHELTFQAMVYDLLRVKNDVYTYKATTGTGEMKERDIILDENDDLWVELRHQHIADVSRAVSDKFQDFAQKKKLKHAGDPDISIKDLARHIRRVPQYQKELSRYSLHITLVDQCLKLYREGINEVCKVEQNLATGTDPQGEEVKDPMKDMMPCLFNRKISVYDKVRLLMLYVLFKKGVSRDDFLKLVQHSEIPVNERKLILNLMHFGYKVLNEESVKASKSKIKSKERPGEKYETSRWTPLLQDIAEYAAADSLDDSYCAWLRGKPRPTSTSLSSSSPATAQTGVTGTSVRQRWNWIPKDNKDTKSGPGAAAAAAKKSGPTIIIFIVGGLSYSEMRAAYDASEATNREVIVGSTGILTPSEFLGGLKNLKPLVTA